MERTRGHRRRLGAGLLGAVAALAVAGASVPGAAVAGAAPTCDAGATARYVVTLGSAAERTAGAVRAYAEGCGGAAVSVQPAVGTMVVDVPAGAVAGLAAVPGVAGVTPDATARPAALTFDPATQDGSMTNVTRISGVTEMWRKGWTGAGVDVALVDTGVAPVAALADRAKVVVGPDLSFDSQNANLRYLDGYGHGTHMGSIIAGREGPKASGAAYAADTKNFLGVAPDARLISVKVGANDGAADVSQLVAAIDWVVQNRNADGMDIKVLNLSFGTDSTQDWRLDPLSHAAEVATRAGILVVAAVGNDGENARGLADPAYNPHVMAVGAVDTLGTDRFSDDEIPSFSQKSDSVVVSRKPDLVAPGVGIVAPAVPGSMLATKYPDALLGAGGRYLRGSGTSQAAAVVSGSAALLWQKWPDLSPVQIRQMLVDSTDPLPGVTANVKGEGELDMAEAVRETPAPTPRRASALLGIAGSGTGTGVGSLQGARGSQSLVVDGVQLTGERDIFGRPWVGATMGLQTAAHAAWTLNAGLFNGSQWIGGGFTTDTATVAGKAWNGRTWAGRTWAGSSWSGRTWAGRTWAGRTWAGGTWTGGSWTDPVTLSDDGFASRTWASKNWR